MPHISDLSQNVIWTGNNGERWIVLKSFTSTDVIDVQLKRLQVEEHLTSELIKDF